MTKTQLLLSAAFAGMMSASSASASETKAALPETAKVKCYGIAKAGQNECANLTGTHGCHAESKVDNDPSEWIRVSAKECNEKGGKIDPQIVIK